MRLVLGRDHRGVGNDVVHTGAAQCAGVAQVTDLHRRAALCKQLRAAVLRVALQVDGDVQLPLACLGDDAVRAPVFHVHEPIEALRHTLGHRIAFDRTEGTPVKLEPVMIVRGQRFSHEHARGVVVKIRRKVADAQLAPAHLRHAALTGRIAIAVTRIGPSDRMHEGGIIGNRQKEEGCVNPLAFAHIAQQLSYRALDVLPIRDHQLGIHGMGQRGRTVLRAKRQRFDGRRVGLGLDQRLGLQQKYLVLIAPFGKKAVEIEHRVRVVAQCSQHLAGRDPQRRVVGVQCASLLDGRLGQFDPASHARRGGQLGQTVDSGFQCARAFTGLHGLGVTPQFHQRMPPVRMRLCIAGHGGQALVRQRQRVLETLARDEQLHLLRLRLRMVGRERQDVVKALLCLVGLVQLCVGDALVHPQLGTLNARGEQGIDFPHRIGSTGGPHQHPRSCAARRYRGRLQRQRAFDGLQGRCMFVQLRQGHRQVDEGRHMARIGSRSLAQHRFRQAHVARLQRQRAQQIQRLGVRGLARQHLLIQSTRLAELALLMQGECLMQPRIDATRR